MFMPNIAIANMAEMPRASQFPEITWENPINMVNTIPAARMCDISEYFIWFQGLRFI